VAEPPALDDRGLIDRRALLVGGGAAVAGVGVAVAGDRLGWFSVPLLSTPDPDVVVQRYLRRTEAVLLRVYDAALEVASAPDPSVARLVAFRAHHGDHLLALGGDEAEVADIPAPGVADPAAQGLDPAGTVPVPPADPAQGPDVYTGLERQAHARYTTGVRTAQRGGLARTLALAAAAEDGHAWGWSRG
jgi:hypothetical protein